MFKITDKNLLRGDHFMHHFLTKLIRSLGNSDLEYLTIGSNSRMMLYYDL